ncbi:MAG: CRISPR-associated exonuclease Cas4 [Archaeoglobaceae archaeon]|nr:CRISPR-associated exonuclease Cas4 [Archaeoglobaceae archaeon]
MKLLHRNGKLDVSDVVQFLYCPRKVYFMKIAGFRITKPKMEEGKVEQEKALEKLEKIAEKLGGKLLKNVPLESEKYGLKGILDALIVAEELLPVDVKLSKFSSISYAWKMQMTAYSLLVEEKFDKIVKKACIFLNGKLKEIPITPEDKKNLERVLEQIWLLLETEKYPTVIKSKKCGYCEMQRFC